jgi:hypothetical protein
VSASVLTWIAVAAFVVGVGVVAAFFVWRE